MDLITDHPRIRTASGGRGSVPVEFASPEPDGLAAWSVLLYHYTYDAELAIAVDLVDRGQGVLEFTIDPAEPWRSLVRRLRTLALHRVPGAPGAAYTDRPAANSGVDADPVLRLVAGANGAPALLDYAEDLFDRTTVVRMAGHLRRIMMVVTAEPGLAVGAIDLTDSEQRQRIITEFNDTARPYPRDAAIHHLVREHARRTPNRVAVSHASGELTYAELDERADRLARRLRLAGVRVGQPVGLMLPRTPQMVVASLAILKAGGAYLPIDPEYPPERIAFLLADSGAGALVCDCGVMFEFDGPIVRVDTPDLCDGESARSGPEPAVGGDDIAYVMYTSGTTGRPKGVQVHHRGVVRLVRGTDYLDFTADTRMLATSSICFDAATFELWGALLNGGLVHLAGSDVVLSATALGRVLAEQAITTLLVVTPVFHQLIDQDPAVFHPVRQVVVGGDTLSARHVATALEACPHVTFLNGYGPTENTTLSSTHRLTPADRGRVPIGRPVANSSAYVVNGNGYLCPVGVPGELCVGGDGVARGYLNRPELTAAAFQPDPFRPGGRMYRTGDIARWRPDGVLEFFGRRDHQVKVRSFRIEPGEIESTLREHPAVREAVVLARPRPSGADRFLCAFYVSDGAVSASDLRGWLNQRLPSHMIPAALVDIPAMPLNANGKIDIAALPPAPEPSSATARVYPRDEVEHTLVRLTGNALGAGRVGIDDDLRELGADSLTATLLAAGAEAELGVRLPVSQVLRAGTLRRVAELVRAASRDAAPPIPPAPDVPTYPLSPQQSRLYVEQVKLPSAVHYNVPVLLDLPPDTDLDRLVAALAKLAERHDALRTEFVLDGGRARQRIIANITPDVSIVDGPAPPAAEVVRAFDLERAPLWRVRLHRTGASVRLLLDQHQIITDGISLSVLFEELAAGYAGQPLPPPPTTRYRDYAWWTSTAVGAAWRKAQGQHWREVFAGSGSRTDLPLDAPRPPMRSPEGGVVEFELGPDRASGLRALAANENITLFAVLASVYTALLAALCGDADMTVGTPVSGRRVPGLDRTLGMFANTVCLRVNAQPELPFTTYVRDVASVAEDAFAHQDYPLEDLIADVAPRRDYRRIPLFDALIALHSGRYLSVDFAGRRLPLRPQWSGQAAFDLNMQIYQQVDRLRVSWQYASRILRHSTVQTWREAFARLIDAVLAEPATRLGELARTVACAAGPAIAAASSGRLPDFDFDFDLS